MFEFIFDNFLVILLFLLVLLIFSTFLLCAKRRKIGSFIIVIALLFTIIGMKAGENFAKDKYWGLPLMELEVGRYETIDRGVTENGNLVGDLSFNGRYRVYIILSQTLVDENEVPIEHFPIPGFEVIFSFDDGFGTKYVVVPWVPEETNY